MISRKICISRLFGSALFGLIALVFTGNLALAGQEMGPLQQTPTTRPALSPTMFRGALLLQQQRQQQQGLQPVPISRSPLLQNRLWQQQLQRPQGLQQSTFYQAPTRSGYGYGSALRQITAPAWQTTGPTYQEAFEQKRTQFTPTVAGQEKIFQQNAAEINKLQKETQDRIDRLIKTPGYEQDDQAKEIVRENILLLRDLRSIKEASSPYTRQGLSPTQQQEMLRAQDQQLDKLRNLESRVERETIEARRSLERQNREELPWWRRW